MLVAQVVIATLCIFNTWADDQVPTRLTFDTAKIGAMPPGWKSAVTGKADGSAWKIVEDKTAPGGLLAVAQTSQNAGPIFNMCIAEGAKYKDVDISVAFKAISGKTDQGGGIAWRIKDNNNYYVVRYNPIEENFRLYKVIGGKRMELLYIENVKADADKWHTIRVVHNGDKIQCFLNGKMLIEKTDDTFKDAGQIALWTKSDAQTYFADVQITAKKE